MGLGQSESQKPESGLHRSPVNFLHKAALALESEEHVISLQQQSQGPALEDQLNTNSPCRTLNFMQPLEVRYLQGPHGGPHNHGPRLPKGLGLKQVSQLGLGS